MKQPVTAKRGRDQTVSTSLDRATRNRSTVVFPEKLMGISIGAGWIILTQPAWLLAMPIVLLPVLSALWARRRGRRIPVPAVVVQCLALAVATVAMTRPRAAISRRSALPYLLLADVSGSVRGQGADVQRLTFPAGAKVERFRFADGIGRVASAGVAQVSNRVAQVSNLCHDATRIAPVLRMIASHGSDSLAAAVIVTDGRFTDADGPAGQAGWAGAAEAVAELGAEVFIVPLDAPPPDARIVAFTVRRVSATKVEIAATVSSNAPVRRTLTVKRSGRTDPLTVRTLPLLPDTPATVRLTDTIAPDAAAGYSARLDGDVVITENDLASTLVLPTRRTVAAVGFDRAVRPILNRIRHPIIFISPDALPEADSARPDMAAAVSARFSCIIVADATGSSLTARQRRALAEYVRAGGGGLVMIGTGPHESPADRSDPLNLTLPLAANPFRRRPLHLSVLLDKSGSMAQPGSARPGGSVQIKFDLAAEAVIALKDHLTPRDALTVIAFANRPGIVYDSGNKSADFAALRDALKKVRPAGSTRVTPAIEMALMRPVAAGTAPMLLVVSDLKTESFNPAEWAAAFRQAGAKLAVVAVREGSAAAAETDMPEEPPLKALAGLLDAPYVERDRLAGLAKVFAALVRRGRGSVVRRRRTAVTVTGAVFDTDLTTFPDLDSYILAGARRDAEVFARTSGGDPLLGVGRAGLGRCVCLSVPLTKTDNAAWARSAEAKKLIASALRWSLRGPDDPRFDVEIKRNGSRLKITVTARESSTGVSPVVRGTGVSPVVRGTGVSPVIRGTGVSPVAGEKPLNNLSLTAELVASLVAGDEHTQSVKLNQIAPGRYEVQADWPTDLPAAVAVRDKNGSTVWRGSTGRLYPREYRLIGADRKGLELLANLTGGSIVQANRLGEVLKQSYRRRLTDLWPGLLGLALALMLTEWCLVRITRR